jgi:3,4-dihydroxy 2-butanone 4-phosphate synthase/GTP cyclohydrolase II
MPFAEYLSPIEEIIEVAKSGRMFILIDDESRENEGDLVIPAQHCDPDKVNFMAKHGRGLICLALTRQRVEQLGLPLMAQGNESCRPRSRSASRRARASPPASRPPIGRAPSRWRSIPARPGPTWRRPGTSSP